MRLCRWQELDAENIVGLAMEDIPWPPDLDAVLHETARLAMQCNDVLRKAKKQRDVHCYVRGKQISDAAYRKAFRILSLRWHPDKFQSRCGSLLGKENEAAIMQRVCIIFQHVSSQWQSHVRNVTS